MSAFMLSNKIDFTVSRVASLCDMLFLPKGKAGGSVLQGWPFR